jgi:type I restriction-modification system DNA methylase subunit
MTVLSIAEVKKRLTAFAKAFKDAKDEQQQASIFWTRFYECYGIRAEEATIYEQRVNKLDGKRGRIDSFIPGLLIVEHKSKGRDLDSAYEQASDYFLALAPAERPKYIITSDFARIRLYDLTTKSTYECTLTQLPSKANWFKFLMQTDNVEIVEETPVNRNAAYAISKLHESLIKNKFSGEDLEIFLTRLLFCMFADDTGIFNEDQLLRRLLASTKLDGSDLGSKLIELFEVLNTPIADRQTTLDDHLAAFPYVNGSLFAERTRIPSFNSELRKALIECSELDWSKISPAIFGAMFQGVLEEHNPSLKRQSTRRELGAHYTSERNILRVINPLFMDELREELEAARRSRAKLQVLYDKLPKLKFFDPACGCGNFLVIAYRELRRFEFEVISELFNFEHGKGLLDVSTLCRVQLTQFYGIEIDDAAVHIARVALYITDHQLNIEAAEKFGNTRPTIPLSATPLIRCDNALKVDWNSVISNRECTFVFGNPPFIGHHLQTESQKKELLDVYGHLAKSAGVMDYVTAWYLLAAKYIKDTSIKVAFVSTNSITQGEQVGILWRSMEGISKFYIHFAHRTFKWSNDAKGKAAVYCVIICFAHINVERPVIFDYKDVKSEPTVIQAKQINAYLVDAAWILLENRNKNPFNAPEMMYGSKPTDGGHYLFSDDEKFEFLNREPQASKFVKPFIGAHEFLHNEKRWVLWLVDATPSEINNLTAVKERVQAVDRFRKSSKASSTRDFPYPTLFRQITQPKSSYVLIPGHTSENRSYIPFGFFDKDTIVGNSCFSLPNAGLYHFAIIQSRMHMAWVSYTCGRIKSDYRYSKDIVYNNFVWPTDVKDSVRIELESTAQKILDARSLYPSSTLADLYDPFTMPVELRKAHDANNKATDKAYGYKGLDDDASRVAFLFKLYDQTTSLFPSVTTSKRKTKAVT